MRLAASLWFLAKNALRKPSSVARAWASFPPCARAMAAFSRAVSTKPAFASLSPYLTASVSNVCAPLKKSRFWTCAFASKATKFKVSGSLGPKTELPASTKRFKSPMASLFFPRCISCKCERQRGGKRHARRPAFNPFKPLQSRRQHFFGFFGSIEGCKCCAKRICGDQSAVVVKRGVSLIKVQHPARFSRFAQRPVAS